MPIFKARIINANGQQLEKKIEGESLDAVRQYLLHENFFIIELSEQRAQFKFRKISSFNVVIFVHELKTLLQSGLSIIEGLDVLLSHHAEADKNSPVYRIKHALHQGMPLSQAMLSCGENVFPPLLVATVAASERNGTLIQALNSYIRYDEQISSLKSKIYNASMYPLLLVGMAVTVSLFLLMYLVPRFGAIYEGVDMDLPLASKLMLELGVWLGEYRTIVIVIMILSLIYIVRKILINGIENTLMQFLSAFRPLGRRLEIVFLSRFFRGLALLLDAGASVVQSFDMLASILTPAQQQQLYKAKDLILQGNSLSDSLYKTGLSTSVSARLLAAGDQNGEISAMLRQSADFHDLDLSQFIERFSRLLEPILMLVIGLFIGMIVVLLYMPIFEMASGLQS
ncbi:type II secretion system F family protein [Acinetobacter pittii]|uniref:type II secretion system F family protein n=1 Tax=Acinetobacter pittii TaxID=48296 RepID=UPI0019821222|nr:type II secretion system F family protein [Acinetobacter pittii]MBN6535012.1 type II secretion system F family protein [Acinetobacter pittii]